MWAALWPAHKASAQPTSWRASDTSQAKGAQKFVDVLKASDLIYAPDLERAVLLLDDQPGVDATPVIKPGQTVGTGDLDVELKPLDKVGGSIGLSNHGNRYTGYLQARANAFINSLFQFGDQLNVTALQSEEDLSYGAGQQRPNPKWSGCGCALPGRAAGAGAVDCRSWNGRCGTV